MILKQNVRLVALSFFIYPISTNIAVAAEANKNKDKNLIVMERVMVIGTKEKAKDITGSAQFIDKKELEKHNYTDVNRVLRQVPGVNIQEEEGYGNRTNIGLRGGRSERSADITLMEDGILIAPAPYSAPAAYYFPRIARMEGTEVRKGSSTIKFGPRTTSGAINFISSSVPSESKGSSLIGYGSNNTKRTELNYGNSHGNFGYVFDLGHEETDGFKTIDIVGDDTGYSIQDFMGKFRIASDPTAKYFQSLEFKAGATEEDSNETYLGITDADFAADPFRRYAASQKDNMDAGHKQYHLRHFIDMEGTDITTTLYRNDFSRSWYKLNDVMVGGTRLNLGPALNNSTYLAVLKGETDLDGGANNHLRVRDNNRNYYSQGIQSDLLHKLDIGKTKHELQGGVRFHYDIEERFQKDDRYAITDGVMTLTSAGAPGSQANSAGSANATALYALDEIKTGDWTFIPGLRYEHINLKNENFTSGAVIKNSVNAIVPGVGLSYALTDKLNVFGGAHKGFAPPAPGSTDQQEEESINYEAGARYENGNFKSELVGFYNDYENLLGECTNASGCTNGNIGDQFNAGTVEVHGIETSTEYDLAALFGGNNTYQFPLRANYTYTKAEFGSDFTSAFEEWAVVRKGYAMPYIPEHQAFVSIGVVDPKWEVHLGGKYVGRMRTQAGSGPIPDGQGTDEQFITDISAEYEIIKNTRTFVNIENAFDQEYIAARRPAGARPGKPFGIFAGLKYKF
jgi:Fe(3+) dicitrate transport protein